MPESNAHPKVLIVSSYGPPHPGGLERAVTRIFEEEKQRGVPIRWLLSDVPAQEAAPDTIRVKVWNQLDTKFRLAIPVPTPSAYAKLWQEIAQCDVVHLHDGYYFISFAGAIMARLQGKKTVLTIHIWKVSYKNRVIQLMQRAAFALMVTPTLAMVDSLVTINRSIFEMLKARGKEPHYIPHGVDPIFATGRDPLPVAELRQQHGLPLDKKIVIFAGRYSLKKGLTTVREIVRKLPDVFFVMCGTGPESPEKWGLPNVVNVGWVNPVKLKSLFSCADLFLLPSRGEGFPLTVQEAMSQGLPCAVFEETWSALSDVRELFCILDDYPTPAEGVRAFLARTDHAEISATAFAYAQTHWTVEAMASAYLQVYRDTCEVAVK
jgi:glycosyltransferase involved in cell wall biosynthesis